MYAAKLKAKRWLLYRSCGLGFAGGTQSSEDKILSLIPHSPETLHFGDVCEMSLQDLMGFITGLKHSLFSGNCHAGLHQETEKVIPGLSGSGFLCMPALFMHFRKNYPPPTKSYFIILKHQLLCTSTITINQKNLSRIITTKKKVKYWS